ncbi:hypothetical protein ACEQ8H_005514 [Pleosporales sp. CAS-2024a]
MSSWKKRTRSVTSPSPNEALQKKRRIIEHEFKRDDDVLVVPETQSALQLHAVRQAYCITDDYAVPAVHDDGELLIKVTAVGLNPIDWKAPDYNFGIPTLPYIAGRELSGTVVKASQKSGSRIQKGHVVIVPSTDYRDLRKAAFQHYSITSTFNAIRIPNNVSTHAGSILGVAFVSAVLALGICMGADFSSIEGGPDLLEMVRNVAPGSLPADIQHECLQGIGKAERAKAGDFLVIWGGSSTCAYIAKQIARLAGLRIVSIIDSAKHGLRLSCTDAVRSDLLVDSHDPDRAIEIVKANTGSRARFGLDTVGKESAKHLSRALATPPTTLIPHTLPKETKASERTGNKLMTPPSTPHEKYSSLWRSHLVGLTGLPKDGVHEDVALHNVPIKLFHEVPEIGEAMCAWCERLLAKGLLVPPDVVGTVEGLEGINGGLDRMRRREISGGRLVALLK